MGERSKKFHHTVSVRQHIIEDEESTLILLEMVKTAYEALLANKNNVMFRRLLTELMYKDESIKPTLQLASRQQLFACGDLDNVDFEIETVNQLLDAYVIELLRFLAMKVLLESIPPNEDESILQQQQRKSRRDAEIKNRHSLVPSRTIRDAWKALVILPYAYAEVCSAFGCANPLDYDGDNEMLEYPFFDSATTNSEVKRARQCYRFTLDAYEKLFICEPSPVFWCRLKMDEVEDIDTSLTTDIANFFDKCAIQLKKTVGVNVDNGIPSNINLH